MRHLTTRLAIAALRRGRSIEQFLGAHHVDGKAGVRWIEIQPASDGYRIELHEVLDLDEVADVYEFPPLVEHDEAYFGQCIGLTEAETEAMALAAPYGADDNRWVNQGMTGDEYHDFVKARWATQKPRTGPNEPDLSA